MFNFLNPKIQGFGIDLSDLSIKVVNLKRNGKKFELASFGRQEIPAGLIENGEIKKEDELISVINKSIKEVRGERLKTEYCVVSLPETESFIRLVHLPLMKKEEIAEAIKWEIEANVPLALPEIYYDWRVIEPTSGHQEHLDIIVGVLPKKTVDPYLSVLKKAGLKPIAFEIESLAIARSLVPNGYCAKTLALIDLGAKKTSLVIFSGQTVYFTASLPISNSSIIATLSENLKIDIDKARQIKIEQGLNYKNPESLIMKALSPALNEMASKIKDYINYYQEHLPAAPETESNMISEIVLCGGGANFAGLPEFLSDKLNLPVGAGNPWANIYDGSAKDIPGLSPGEFLSYTTAIGLAIRGQQ